MRVDILELESFMRPGGDGPFFIDFDDKPIDAEILAANKRTMRRNLIKKVLLGTGEFFVTHMQEMEGKADYALRSGDLPGYSSKDERALLWAMLTDTDDDERGPDTPLNAKGQTALFFIINPEVAGRLSPQEISTCTDVDTMIAVLESGIDPMIKDINGRDCLDYASTGEQVDMIIEYTLRKRPDVVSRVEFWPWAFSKRIPGEIYEC